MAFVQAALMEARMAYMLVEKMAGVMAVLMVVRRDIDLVAMTAAQAVELLAAKLAGRWAAVKVGKLVDKKADS